jgi:hypothetical protein
MLHYPKNSQSKVNKNPTPCEIGFFLLLENSAEKITATLGNQIKKANERDQIKNDHYYFFFHLSQMLIIDITPKIINPIPLIK